MRLAGRLGANFRAYKNVLELRQFELGSKFAAFPNPASKSNRILVAGRVDKVRSGPTLIAVQAKRNGDAASHMKAAKRSFATLISLATSDLGRRKQMFVEHE